MLLRQKSLFCVSRGYVCVDGAQVFQTRVDELELEHVEAADEVEHDGQVDAEHVGLGGAREEAGLVFVERTETVVEVDAELGREVVLAEVHLVSKVIDLHGELII